MAGETDTYTLNGRENLGTLIWLWCPSGTEREEEEALDKVNGPNGVRVSRIWQIIRK